MCTCSCSLFASLNQLVKIFCFNLQDSGKKGKKLMLPNKHITVFTTHVAEEVFSQPCKDNTHGSDTPAKYTTGNMLKPENGNNEEQQHTHVWLNTHCSVLKHHSNDGSLIHVSTHHNGCTLMP